MLRTIDHLPPSDEMVFSVCNEFFDALPIHQFEFNRDKNKWFEVLVDLEPSEDALRFVLAPGDTPASRALLPLFESGDLEGKKRIEVSPGVLYHTQKICEKIQYQGGSALCIDYGHEG